MYNVHRKKNYVLGQAAENSTIATPDLDPRNSNAEIVPALPSIGGLLKSPILYVGLGALAGIFLGPKLHRTRNALIGAAAGFGVNYFMGRTEEVIVMPAPGTPGHEDTF